MSAMLIQTGADAAKLACEQYDPAFLRCVTKRTGASADNRVGVLSRHAGTCAQAKQQSCSQRKERKAFYGLHSITSISNGFWYDRGSRKDPITC